jgi:hypothetical protein
VGGNSFSLEPRNKERVKQVLAKYLRLEWPKQRNTIRRRSR